MGRARRVIERGEQRRSQWYRPPAEAPDAVHSLDAPMADIHHRPPKRPMLRTVWMRRWRIFTT